MSQRSEPCKIILPNGEERHLTAGQVGDFLDAIGSAPSQFWSDGVVIEGGSQDDGWLHIYHADRLGWYVACYGRSDAVERFLVTATGHLGELVKVARAGMVEEYRRGQLVPFEAAAPAIRYFLHHVERDPSLHWIRIDEA